MILVANIEDIDEKLKEIAQAVSNPTGKLWLITVPKAHLLDLDGKLLAADRDENFVQFQRHFFRPKTPAWIIAWLCRGKPVPAHDLAAGKHRYFVLSHWAEEAVQKQQPVYLFDLAATTTPQIWQSIGWIRDWFSSNPPGVDYASLSFQEAAAIAANWCKDTGVDVKHEYLMKCDPSA